MSDHEKVRGVELRAVNLNIKRSFHSVKTKRSRHVPEQDTQSLPLQDSLYDQLEEHIGLVGASSHEPSNAPIPDSQPRINWFDASMHLIKGNLGPGCLNLPHAFARSGWLLGTFLLLVVAIQGIYSMTLLAELKQILLDSNGRTHTFMDVAQASLGSRGHRFVQIFLFVLQAGVCCVFLDLIATNLKSQTSLSTNMSILLVTGALLLIVHVRYMKDLRFLSTSANLFMITAVLTAAVTAVIDIGAHDIALPPRGTSDLGEVATFISTLFFSFEGIGLVLPIGTFSHRRIYRSIAQFLMMSTSAAIICIL
jgi:proton-coupled amino acid transporter